MEKKYKKKYKRRIELVKKHEQNAPKSQKGKRK
jgi:hypothetical protein